MAQSDEALLLACRRGDEAAWEALVGRYQRLIFTIPRRAGLDDDLSSEVFQEVFATLLQNIETIEQPSRLQAWLVTTARRKTWRVIRRASSTQSLSAAGDDEGSVSFEMIADESPLPDEALLQLENQHAVRTALAGMDERCRKLITMLFYAPEPPPYSEIAASLGTTEGSIGPTRARCLQKLLKELSKMGVA